MDEKASRKESGEGTDWRTGVPDIPAGEELSLEPVGGDEIDPLPKWWDEASPSEREKVGNRRLEEVGESEPARRDRSRQAASEALEELDPAPEEEVPVSDPPEALEQEEQEAPPADAGLLGLPEIDLGTIKVKHQRKPVDGEFDALFGETGPEKEEEEIAPPEASTELEEASPEVGEPAPAAAEETPRKPGPPPLPADLGLEVKPPLIPGVDETAKPVPPVKIEAPVEREPAPGPEPAVLPEPPGSGTTEEETGEKVEEEAALPSSSDDRLTEPEPVPEAFPSEEAAEDSPASPEEKDGEGKEEDISAKAESDPPSDPVSEPVPVIGGPLSANADPASPPTKRKAGCWTVFATLFFFATMLVVLLLVGAAVFGWSRVGRFEEEIRTVAEAKLKDRGVHLDYGAWSYEFPHGVVFDEVTLYDDETKARPVAKASALGVNVDFFALARNPGGLGAAELSLSDSHVTLYERGEPFAEIEGVDAEILADASSIGVERLSATVGGLQVRLDGVVKLSGGAEGSGAPAGDAASETPKRSAIPNLDFSRFRAIRPWLAFGKDGQGTPLLSASFVVEGGGLSALEGTFGGEAVRWRGLDLAHLFAAFRFDPATGELRVSNFQADHGEGSIAAVLVVETASRILQIERLQSTVDPVALLSAYDPAWAETFRSVRLVDAPSIQVTGSVPLGEPANAALEIVYSHRLGLVHLQGERELPLSDLRGRFRYGRGTVETNDAALRLFGGEAAINGAVNLQREGRPFNGLVEISGLSLEAAAGWFGEDGAGLSGRLDLTFRGTGSGGIASFNGGGNLRIEEASLPNFPVVGPVQRVLGKVVPAFGAKAAGTVTGAYILESGVLVTSDLTVRNDGARVVTNGSLNLASMRTNFTATAALEPALAAATGLKDKAVVVEGTGPWREPELKIREFPVEFAAAGLGEILGTTPESLGGLKELLGSEDPAAVISGSIEEATGLQIDPAVTDLLRGLLGGKKEEEAKPILRAIPEN